MWGGLTLLNRPLLHVSPKIKVSVQPISKIVRPVTCSPFSTARINSAIKALPCWFCKLNRLCIPITPETNEPGDDIIRNNEATEDWRYFFRSEQSDGETTQGRRQWPVCWSFRWPADDHLVSRLQFVTVAGQGQARCQRNISRSRHALSLYSSSFQ